MRVDDVLARLLLLVFWLLVLFSVTLPVPSAERFFSSASMMIVAASCIAARATASARGGALSDDGESISCPCETADVIGAVSAIVVRTAAVPVFSFDGGATEADVTSLFWGFDSIIEKYVKQTEC